MKSGSRKYILLSVLYAVSLIMMTGSVIQDFLLQNGVPEETVTLYMSVVQIVQIAVTMLSPAYIDQVRNLLRFYAITALLQVCLPLLLFLFCLGSNTTTVILLGVFFFGILTSVFQALYSIASYKVPYHMIDMRDYGSATALSGVFAGIIGTAFSAFMTFATKRTDYASAMAPFFSLAVLFLVLLFAISIRTKPVVQISQPAATTVKRYNLLKYKPFTALIIPNILRGISAGVLGVSMTAGHILGITDSSSGAVLTLLLQVSTVSGCLLYARISKHGNDSRIILISSIATGIAMPLMFLPGSRFFFYLMYFIANFFATIVAYSIPFAITKLVDYDRMGQYTAWRILLHMLGITIANLTITWLLDVLGAGGTMFLIAGFRFLSGFLFYFYFKRNLPA